MAKKTTWILVADGARARLFEARGAPGAPIGDAIREWSGNRRRTSEIMADKPGRTFDSAGGGRHAKAPRTDARDVEEEMFLREVADYVSGKTDAYDALVLVAPATAMGGLRKLLSKQAAARVVDELVKDLTGETPSQLDGHLRALLSR